MDPVPAVLTCSPEWNRQAKPAMALIQPFSRLAVDIGGTFTDLAIEHAGRLFTAKLLTTPAAPEQGVLEARARCCDRPGWTRRNWGS